MCSFCENEMYIGENGMIYFSVESGEYDEYYDEYITIPIQCNFCPSCGIKLTTELIDKYNSLY